MKKNSFFIYVIFLVISGWLLQGCAAILGGRCNTLVFRAESVPQAEIFIDSVYVGDAPGRIRLPKGMIQHGSTLEIKAEGYTDQKFLILRKTHPVYFLTSSVMINCKGLNFKSTAL